jgi:hypothetical protein
MMTIGKVMIVGKVMIAGVNLLKTTKTMEVTLNQTKKLSLLLRLLQILTPRVNLNLPVAIGSVGAILMVKSARFAHRLQKN